MVQARAVHGAHEGTWYMEMTVTHLGESGHARLGWATRKAELQAPVLISGTHFLLYNRCATASEATFLCSSWHEAYP